VVTVNGVSGGGRNLAGVTIKVGNGEAAPRKRPCPSALTRCKLMIAGLDNPVHTVNLEVLQGAMLVCWLHVLCRMQIFRSVNLP